MWGKRIYLGSSPAGAGEESTFLYLCPMQQKKNGQLILILGLLTAIGPFSIDMYLPAFPDIAKHLNTTIAQVMLSLSAFFVGISLGQLIYGPLLERFGRKNPLYVGLSLYIIASIGCITAPNIETLIAFRFFQALGGCVGMVASRAMVRDLFAIEHSARVFSTLMLVVAVSPIVAPTLGGYITALFGWRSVFGVLIALIVLILAGIFFLLPESKQPDPSVSLKPAPILKSFLAVLKNAQFLTYGFTSATAAAGLYAYISGSPHVFMELFKVSEKQYGWIFAIIAIGLILATQLNNIWLKHKSSEKIIQRVLFIQNGIGLLLVALPLLGIFNLFLTIGLIFLYLASQGFLFPNASALSMAPFGHNAGGASALIGFIQMSIGALMSSLVSIFQNDTLLPMTGVMAGCSILANLIYIFGRKKMAKRERLEQVEEEEIELIQTL